MEKGSIQFVDYKPGFSHWIKMLLRRINLRRVLAALVVPFLERSRYQFLNRRLVEAPQLNNAPCFDDKVLAAVYIAVHGADGGGIKTWAALMWPQRKFSLWEVEREASRFLGVVNLALLKQLPPDEKSRLLQDQVENLSFDE